jgi:serine/threonine protein kinase/Tol biopolymer transport system component
MAPAIGTRFGDYEIVSLLGEGGMGAVYLARDHLLKRNVAIKILTVPAPTADTAKRVLNEARSAARLNHPNVATVYEVGHTDDCPFIVMELVEGRTLSELISVAGMPFESVTRYVAQIADALAHAHDRGVIHRDLKSRNIIVTPDGCAKILDFGIAACVGGERDDGTTTQAAAIGGASGTLPYMAPEVLHGESATGLSDIWSLGVLMYEMLAGRLPYTARTPAATASAILRDPLPPLPSQVPASLDAIVHRCLARLPGERYQHPREVRAALDVVRQSYEHPANRTAIPFQTQWRSHSRIWPAASAAALILAALWVLVRIWPSEQLLLVSSQRSIGALGASYRQATVSPDGGFIAFVNADAPVSQIWVRDLAHGAPIAITSGGVTASRPTWSPSNDQIVFARRGQGLWSVPPLGGDARRLIEFGSNPRFSADGERLVFERNGREIWTARADGSGAKRVDGVPVPWYSGGLDPAFSPDTLSIVFFLRELGPMGDLWVIPSGGGTPRQLTHDLTEASGPIWTPDGRFIIFSSMRGGSRTLWRMRPEGGTPEPLTVGVGEDLEPALSRDGRTLLYTNVRDQWEVRGYNVVTGAERVIVQGRRQMIFPRVSPDGSKMAFFGFGDSGDVQIFVVPMTGGAVQQLTQGKGRINTHPRWSPDGTLVYYYQERPGMSFRSVPLSGGDDREVRPWQWESHTAAEFSPDGSFIAYYRQAAPGERPVQERTVVEETASGKARTLGLPLLPFSWSPDARMIVGSTTTDPRVIETCPADGSSCRKLALGHTPVWSPDGSHIYFLRDTTNSSVRELWVMTPDGSDQRKLFDRMGPFLPIDVAYDISRTGDILWSAYIEGRHELWQAELHQ